MKVRISDGKIVPAELEKYFDIPILLIADEEYGTSDVVGWELIEATDNERETLKEPPLAIALIIFGGGIGGALLFQRIKDRRATRG